MRKVHGPNSSEFTKSLNRRRNENNYFVQIQVPSVSQECESQTTSYPAKDEVNF